MTEQKKATKLTPEEAAKVAERGTLVPLSDAEAKIFPPPGKGFSHCENGLCYVSCGNNWLRFVDSNGNQFNCGTGNGKYFDCDGDTYRCFC